MNQISTTARAGSGSLAPQNFGEAVEFSRMLAKSGMVPKDYAGKPENIMVALQWGAEVGLGPLQALNGISIINGKPSLWGDAALALVRGHPACAGVREGVEGEGDARFGWCEVTRRGEQPQRRTFSVADAKKAGLFGKSGPWQQYPDRMLQLRARGFAIRDVFPDALRGVITAEEAQDMPTEQAAPLPPASGPTIQGQAERAPPPPALIVLAPDGTERSAPSIQHWAKWCEAAIAKLEDAAAVARWRADMAPHFLAAEHVDLAAVDHVTGVAQDRMDALADAGEPA
jgi:hypothetical protein